MVQALASTKRGASKENRRRKSGTRATFESVEGIITNEESQKIYDELTGKELNPRKVKQARNGEMEFVKKIQVYEERPIRECWDKTGKRQIPTRWVDILKR